MIEKVMKTNAILILPDIRSTHNVGAIFRTADAVGVSKIYLVGITPSPIDRFGRARPDIAKSALGAEKTIPWESREEIQPLLSELKNDGYTIVAIEQSENSVDYKEVQQVEKMAFVLGPEVTGLPETILGQCDIVAEIPMEGEKESLNVSVATGVALFRILNK
jgi:tRNA G18 (ribose-2'-O)-methylase SpoU